MADKSAIEAIHKLSVENDRLRAEVERLRDGILGTKRPGNYVKIPKGTIIGPLNIMKIQK